MLNQKHLLLHGLSGCPECTKRRMYLLNAKTHEEFVEQLKLSNPNIVALSRYVRDHDKMRLKCLIHNYIWEAPPNKVLHRNTGCPKCASYHNENVLDQILNNFGITNVVCQKRFDDCRNKNTLPFDRYLPEYNVLIEYDGEGHYQPIRRGSMTDKDAQKLLEITQKHDEIKNQYCLDKNIPLIRIPYWEKDNMECFLRTKLNKIVGVNQII